VNAPAPLMRERRSGLRPAAELHAAGGL